MRKALKKHLLFDIVFPLSDPHASPMTPIDETASSLVRDVLEHAHLDPKAPIPFTSSPILWDPITFARIRSLAQQSPDMLTVAVAAAEREFRYQLLERDDVSVEARTPAIQASWWIKDELIKRQPPKRWRQTDNGFEPY